MGMGSVKELLRTEHTRSRPIRGSDLMTGSCQHYCCRGYLQGDGWGAPGEVGGWSSWWGGVGQEGSLGVENRDGTCAQGRGGRGVSWDTCPRPGKGPCVSLPLTCLPRAPQAQKGGPEQRATSSRPWDEDVYSTGLTRVLPLAFGASEDTAESRGRLRGDFPAVGV